VFAALSELSIRNRGLVILAWTIASALGLYSFSRLPIDAVPDVTPVQVSVNTVSPGLGPVEMEQLVTAPVETAMRGLPRVEDVWSLTKTGLSQVTVVFEEGTSIFFARQLVLERLQLAKEELPAGVGTPEMGPITTGLGQIYEFAVEGPDHSLRDLRAELDWSIRPQLLTVPGVTEVNAFGGQERQYEVHVDPAALHAYGLTLGDIFDAVAANNANSGGAFIEHGMEQYHIRGVGLADTVQDLRNIVLKGEDGTPVQLREVARIVEGSAPRQGAVTMNGQEQEVVVGQVMMLYGANSRTVARAVKAKLGEISKTLPPGMSLRPYYDRTELVDATIHTVGRNLCEGGLLVVAVLFAFLGNLRAALIVALAIPASMLVAATGMVRSGVTGNLMSLGAIDFGLIVDGAVVMAENITRRLAHRRDDEPALPLIVAAAREVSRPVAFAVGIIIIVYLPVLTLQGIEGKYFRPMALTVVYALAGALLLALTLTPALCALLLRRPLRERALVPMAALQARYGLWLDWALSRRRTVAWIATVTLLAAGLVFQRLGSEFVPTLDEGALAASVVRLPSISLGASLDINRKIERELKRIPEVRDVVSRTGTPKVADDPMGPEESDTVITLEPQSKWRSVRSKAELTAKVEERLSVVPGAKCSLSQPIQLRVNCLVSGVRSDVAVKVFGPDMAVLEEQAQRVRRVLAEVPGATEPQIEQVAGLPVLQVRARRDALARYQVNVAQVLEVVETAIGGKEASEFVAGQRRWPIVVRLGEAYRSTPEDIGSILVEAGDGSQVPLAEVCDIDLVSGPAQISREQAQRRVVVECGVRGRDIGRFVSDAQKAIAREVKLPPGYYLDWGGSSRTSAALAGVCWWSSRRLWCSSSCCCTPPSAASGPHSSSTRTCPSP